MRNLLILMMVVLMTSGCSSLRNLNELLTLKGMADEAALMERDVEVQNRNFEKLLKVVQGQGLDQYSKEEEIFAAFGEPIFIKKVEKDNQTLWFWLYRYADRYARVDKVYIYFDTSGKLVFWEYVPAKEKAQEGNNIDLL